MFEEGEKWCGCLDPRKREKRSYARCKQERADLWIDTGEIPRLDSAERSKPRRCCISENKRRVKILL
jgi:hypothetical protein